MKKHLYIDGQLKEAKHYEELYSPFSGECIAIVAQADEQDTDEAIQAAKEAAKTMAKMPAHKRAAILEKVASLLEQRKEEMARILALEAAKPLKTARGEITRTIQTYKFAATEARQIHGETVSPYSRYYWLGGSSSLLFEFDFLVVIVFRGLIHGKKGMEL